jgi:hypothetical protein
MRVRRRALLRAGLAAATATLLSRPALAHAGNLGGTDAGGAIPLWLVAITGGGIVGVSFLFATFVTDHDAIRRVNAVGLGLPSAATVRRAAVAVGRAVGVAGLVTVLVSGCIRRGDTVVIEIVEEATGIDIPYVRRFIGT